MAKLIPIPYAKLEKFVKYVGCVKVRQKGSHIIYKRDGLKRPVIIPRYNDIPVFIIRNILRQLELSIEDYFRIVKEI